MRRRFVITMLALLAPAIPASAASSNALRDVDVPQPSAPAAPAPAPSIQVAPVVSAAATPAAGIKWSASPKKATPTSGVKWTRKSSATTRTRIARTSAPQVRRSAIARVQRVVRQQRVAPGQLNRLARMRSISRRLR